MKKLIVVMIITLLLMGCSNKAQENSNNADDNTQGAEVNTDGTSAQAEAGYLFEYNGVTIDMNAEAAPVVEAMGEPQQYFEAESCAFKGLDKIYYYNGIEISTYPMEDKDYISSVDLVDDSVSTTEGIFLGSTKDEMLQAYGDNYSEESGLYTYTLGDTNLTFLVENDEIAAITYLAIVEALQ